MFYIYYGYVSEDNYDASERPIYNIKECDTAESVVAFKKEFEEDYPLDVCDTVIFRVFEGKERTISSRQVVTEYVLD